MDIPHFENGHLPLPFSPLHGHGEACLLTGPVSALRQRPRLSFSALAVSLVWLNRRSLVYYVEKAKGIFVNREALAAVVLVTLVVGLFGGHALHVR